MVIHQPKSLVGIAALGSFAAFLLFVAVTFQRTSPRDLLVLLGFGLFFCVRVCLEFSRASRCVIIDSTNNQIIVRQRSLFLFIGVQRYSLDSFGSVVSYIRRSPGLLKNVVELIAKKGGEALLIVEYDSAFVGGKAFFSSGSYIETIQARNLRISLAEQCGIADRGFLGNRFAGAAVEPER